MRVMKKMRKILDLGIVAAMMCTCMAGCGSESEETTTEATTAAATEAAAEEEETTEAAATDDATAADAELTYYDGVVYIGQSTWIGYAPLFIAQDKGFFKDHGQDIQIQEIQSKADSRSALASGEIQAVSSTVDTQLMTNAAGIDVVQVLALDTSCGGDGVVCVDDIESIADMAGKSVAIDTTGGASFFWFQYLLQQEGMTLDDVAVNSMSSGDAGAAFVAGQVDAAVTWQPWLTNAKDTDFGKVLVDSSETPGIIVDTIAVDREFAETYPGAVDALIKGWYDALAFIESDYDEACEIMAEHMGQSVEDFQASLPEVSYYDEAGNVAYFDSSTDGNIYEIAEIANDLWIANEFYTEDEAPVIEDVISADYVKVSE